jgi:CheY-like chemotaxis protein
LTEIKTSDSFQSIENFLRSENFKQPIESRRETLVSKKLLLADDSVTIQKVVNLTFADEGIEVITAGDGDAARQMISESAPDLVMADVNMPGISGYELCEQIKQNENTKNTPVILLVGSFEPFDEAEARRVGADDFLTKPFQSIRQLVNKVTTLLDSAANGQTAAAHAAGSFADTKEFDQPAAATGISYGDAGMDDDMIQSNSSAGFAFDERQKFSTGDYEEKTEDDLAGTPPFAAEDFPPIEKPGESFSYSETTATVQTYEYRQEISREFTEEARESPADRQTEEIPQPKTASLLEFDDDDFLELPPLFDEEEFEPPAKETPPQTAAPAAASETAAAAEPSAAPETFQSGGAATEYSAQFPPELIDAVARRVVEQLSDRAVREIAWEVVPQQAELIIKKMVEEKLKQ